MDRHPEEVRERYERAFPGETGVLAYRLAGALTEAHVNLSEYRTIFGREENFAILNWAAPAFFARMQWTLLSEVVLSICRITDPPGGGDKKSASLPRLVEDLKQDDRCQYRSWKGRLDEVKGRSKRLNTARNEVIAHADLKHVSAVAPPGVSLRDVEDALIRIRELFNTIQSEYLGKPTLFEHSIPPLGGASSLMGQLTAAKGTGRGFS